MGNQSVVLYVRQYDLDNIPARPHGIIAAHYSDGDWNVPVYPNLTMVYEIKGRGTCGWIEATKDGYDNVADWNRRIIYVATPSKGEEDATG